MKKRTKKIFISLIAASTIFTSSYTALASGITVNMPYDIYSTQSSEYLASGVKYENIKKFSYLGWWNINVIRMDLKNEYTELKGMFNKEGLSKRDTVSNMVDKHNSVAGVNGDYFNYSPLPSSMGGLISEGEIISSPIELAYAFPSFYLTHDNEGGVSYLDRRVVVTDLVDGTVININTLNKVTAEFDTLTLLNRNWGSKTIGTRFHADLIEVIVEDDQIKDIRIGQEATDIPENGYAIIGRGARAEFLKELTIGHKVKLDVSTTPDVDSLKFAIGGGSIILKDGNITLTDINSKGNNPRTGIGINKDNTEMILVTIDGRDSSFKGVSQEMFGAIMKELGAYNALNLDGGGSTAMAIKPLGDEKSKLVNKPSEGSQRLVVNGVGVFSNAPKSDLSYLKLSTDDNKMFVNTSRNISIKGYDSNHHPVQLDSSKLKFSVEGVDGEFTSNKFKSLSSGTAKITADYDGIKEVIEIKVLDTLKDIKSNVTEFSIDINSKYTIPSFKGKDSHGTEAKIYAEDIAFTITGDIGYIENGVFFSGKTVTGGAITAKAGEGVCNIFVGIGSKSGLIDSFEDPSKYAFAPHPEAVTGSISSSADAVDGKSSLSLKYDFSQGENTRAAYIMLNPENSGMTIEGSPQKLGLWVKGDNSGSWLRAIAVDKAGNEHYLDFSKNIDWQDWKYLEASIPNNFSYPMKLQRIYLVETNSLKKQSGEIFIDSLNAYYPSYNKSLELPTASNLKDELNKKMDVSNGGFTFVVGYEPKDLDKNVGFEASKSISSAINQSKIGVSINKLSDGLKQSINNFAYIDGSNGYKVNKHMETLFISLDSSKNGIRETNADQWFKLKDDLKNRTEKNIVLTLPTPIFGGNGFTDKLEAELLHETLVSAKENGKNIIVVHAGNKTNLELRDGIRYIQINTKDIKSKEDLNNVDFIKFYTIGDKISYEFIKIF